MLSPTFPRQGKSACSSKISGGMYCEAEWVSGHPGAGAGIEGALSFHFQSDTASVSGADMMVMSVDLLVMTRCPM